MDECCETAAAELSALRGKQRRVLVAVLTVNALMFAVEFVSGWVAHSTALTADSLDMLGDALIYAISLYAVGRGARWQTGLAFAKGAAMLGLGTLVLGQIALTLWLGQKPHEAWMGSIGLLALTANLACLLLLTRHRHDDLNLRSTWACARNDVLANLGVLAAALGVSLTGTGWPDILAGAAISVLVIGSASRVLRDAVVQWNGGTIEGVGHGHDHQHHGHPHARSEFHTHAPGAAD
jgi:cation diffusion facilitator family transporter